MEIRALVISLIIAAGVITGVFQFYAAFMTQYSITGVSNVTFSKANETMEMLHNMEAPITAPQQKADLGAFLLSIPSGAIEAGRMLLGSIDLMRTLITDLFATVAGATLAKWFVDMLTAIVGAIIIFELVSMLLKYKT